MRAMRPSLSRAILGPLAALLMNVPFVAAQAPAPSFAPDAVIPFDSAVKTGTLPNGLRFMIRRNDQPAKRVALRLAVKAGSLDEADDQQGLAHFLEHMAFNGSAHFKPGELVSYFEAAGARLGPHVNAYTSFDETVYMLELPTDSAELVSKGFTALADFAGGLTLDPEQVDKERGVVIEEWRGRLGAGSRVRDKQIPVLYNKSRYAERLPIGKPEILRTAPVAASARVLRHLLSSRSHGGDRGRRHRPAADRGGDPRRVRPDRGARTGRRAAGRLACRCIRAPGQRRHRP